MHAKPLMIPRPGPMRGSHHPEPRTRPNGAGWIAWATALLALAIMLYALWQLESARHGVRILTADEGRPPMTLYRPSGAQPSPLVVIAHGFAGSQRMMQAYALTLARNGYLVVTFDFPGHGRNPVPFVKAVLDPEARVARLTDALRDAIDWGLAQPQADGRLALLGHSMAGDILARFAASEPSSRHSASASTSNPTAAPTSTPTSTPTSASTSASIQADSLARASGAALSSAAPRQSSDTAGVAALVLVSPYLSGAVEPERLANLLVIYGALEPEMLHRQGAEAISEIAGGEIEVGETYGEHQMGTARRLSLVSGVEHIGVLYARDAHNEALEWLNESFGRAPGGRVEPMGGSLMLLYLGIIALAWPLARWLRPVTGRAQGAGVGWRVLLPVAILPALVTPLILWRLPSDFLPILIADYLALHFGIYGLLTAGLLWYKGRVATLPPDKRAGTGMQSRQHAVLAAPEEPGPPGAAVTEAASARDAPIDRRALLVALIAVPLYALLAFALPTERYVSAALPGPERLALLFVVLPGTLLYFLADEWATRGPNAARGGYWFTKLCFLVSLLLAIALNLEALFFLVIILPAIMAVFLVYGLLGSWVYRSTCVPWVAAIANALVVACALVATFPLVDA